LRRAAFSRRRYAGNVFAGGIGPMEIFLVLIVVLVIFGPKRLPGLGKQLGRGMREFRDSITDRHDRDDDEDVSAALGRPEAASPASTDTPPAAPEPVATEAAPASDVSRPPR
jgi:sec-independent protein translocase protein TatA